MRGMGTGLVGPKQFENLLGVSWYNAAAVPHLNPLTVMDYFANHSNPFYDRMCNNEIIKMQRLSADHLVNMTGVEYVVLHTQEPILYIIRKQKRSSPNNVSTLSPLGNKIRRCLELKT
jgi:mediator of RNA polymerase II transcription subunit 6